MRGEDTFSTTGKLIFWLTLAGLLNGGGQISVVYRDAISIQYF